VAATTGYQLTGHVIEVEGVCTGCQP
jgi:Fe2+ or Zn2+ uptake regulation protein